jgi:hypothetical protein
VGKQNQLLLSELSEWKLPPKEAATLAKEQELERGPTLMAYVFINMSAGTYKFVCEGRGPKKVGRKA